MEFLLISDFRISIVLTSAIIVGVRKPLTHFDLILTGQLCTNESLKCQREQTNYRCWIAVHPFSTKIQFFLTKGQYLNFMLMATSLFDLFARGS